MYIYCDLNYFLKISMVLKIISLSTVLIYVHNTKHPLSVIKMIMLHNFNITIQNFNYNLLYLSFWLRVNSELPILNDKVNVVIICVNNNKYYETVDKKWLDLGNFPSPSFSGITGILYFLQG